MKKEKAFTLIELLVVISIIALLMAILMPALSRVKAQAKDALCKSNLHQFGLIWMPFLQDRNNRFLDRDEDGGSNDWMPVLFDYAHRTLDLKLFMCPMATKCFTEGGRNPFMAGEPYVVDTPKGDVEYKWSYGINLWTSDRAQGKTMAGCRGEYWRTPHARKAQYGLVLIDSQQNNIEPYPCDIPSPYEHDVWTPGAANEMRRSCIKRHPPYNVNGLYMDWSVRSMNIKQNWRTHWYADWQMDYPLPVWPAWMDDVPEPIY